VKEGNPKLCIPILSDHDWSRPIGTAEFVPGGIRVRVPEGLTLQQIRQVFGDVGFATVKAVDWPSEGAVYTEFVIHEFSMDPRQKVACEHPADGVTQRQDGASFCQKCQLLFNVPRPRP
jgi:hypothetical protein